MSNYDAAPYEPKICYECDETESLEPTAEEFLMCGWCGEYFCGEHIDQTEHDCPHMGDED